MLVLDSWAQSLGGPPAAGGSPGAPGPSIELGAAPGAWRGGGADGGGGSGGGGAAAAALGSSPLQRRTGGGGGSTTGSPERRKPGTAAGALSAPVADPPPPPFRMLGSRGGSVLLGLLVHSAADGLAVGAAALGLEPTVSATVAAAMVGHKVRRAAAARTSRPQPRRPRAIAR
jgi:hypothetical protein